MTYPIEKQVITLEQAKKLAEIFKAAGVAPPESYFVWVNGNGPLKLWPRSKMKKRMPNAYKAKGYVNAYTCAEMGVLLPGHVKFKEYPEYRWLELVAIKRKWDEYAVGYHEVLQGHNILVYSFAGKHEAHAKCDLLIELLNQKLIKPEDLGYE